MIDMPKNFQTRKPSRKMMFPAERRTYWVIADRDVRHRTGLLSAPHRLAFVFVHHSSWNKTSRVKFSGVFL